MDAASERLGDLFDRHHRRLYRLARRMSRDPDAALDLVQEAFLRAARRPAAVPASDDGAEAWLVRVVVNLCRDRWRRLRVRRGGEAPLPRIVHGRRSGPESRTVARRTVEAGLARLSPRRRAVVVLHELEDRDTDEIAELLDIRPGTVRYHLSKGRRDLARILGEDGDD